VTIFQQIIEGTIPADIVYQDDAVLAFRDINPQAPTHILIIPKKAVAGISSLDESDRDSTAALFLAAKRIAIQESLTDYRLVINNGAGAGQTVFHLHLHLLGGRPFTWPPG